MNWIKSFIIDIKFVSLQRKTKDDIQLLLLNAAKHALKNSDIDLTRLLIIIRQLSNRRNGAILWNILECPVDVCFEQIKYAARNAVGDSQKKSIRHAFDSMLSQLSTGCLTDIEVVMYKKYMRWYKRCYGMLGSIKTCWKG